MSVEYKGYVIAGDGNFGMKEIKPVGKGSIPMSLRGKYTTTYRAQIAIDTYLEEKSPKVE